MAESSARTNPVQDPANYPVALMSPGGPRHKRMRRRKTASRLCRAEVAHKRAVACRSAAKLGPRDSPQLALGARRIEDGCMGYAKDQQLTQDEQGWLFTDALVCPACVNEQALKGAVVADVRPTEPCSFCGSDGAAPLDTLMAAFVAGIRRMYYRAVDELGWDGREGGWQGASTVDSSDLVSEYEHCFAENGLADAVRHSLEQTDWVAKDFARPSTDAALIEGWARFCHQIKYETRYVIWRRRDERTDTYSGDIAPASVHDAVGELVGFFQKLMVREVSSDTAFWRARPHHFGQNVRSSKELGTTPTAISRTNRMSPAGIPMFYGALDLKTADLEATQECRDDVVSVGAFHASRSLTLLDLTRLREPPSVFAVDGDERPQWLFLQAFARTLRAKPTLPDIDYVPTQVVTEYFIKVFEDGAYFDGILYSSDIDDGGDCVVLNVPNERCVDMLTTGTDDQIELELELDVATVTSRPLLR